MVHILGTVLTVLYGMLAVYVSAQLVLLFRQKHKPTSYKAIFNWFALAWLVFRVLYWATFSTNVDVPDVLSYLLFWLPHTILFFMFATLALFLTKVVRRRQWTGRLRNKILRVYGVAGFLDAALTITLAVIAGISGDVNDLCGRIEAMGTGIIFLFLSGIFVVLGRQLRRLPGWEYARMFEFSPAAIALVTFLLAFVFSTRAVFNFVSFSGKASVSFDNETLAADLEAGLAYLAWEFFPVILLLSTIATGPIGLCCCRRRGYQALGGADRGGGGSGGALGSGDDAAAASVDDLLNFGVFGAIAAMDLDAENAGAGTLAPGGVATARGRAGSSSGGLSGTPGLHSLGDPFAASSSRLLGGPGSFGGGYGSEGGPGSANNTPRGPLSVAFPGVGSGGGAAGGGGSGGGSGSAPTTPRRAGLVAPGMGASTAAPAAPLAGGGLPAGSSGVGVAGGLLSAGGGGIGGMPGGLGLSAVGMLRPGGLYSGLGGSTGGSGALFGGSAPMSVPGAATGGLKPFAADVIMEASYDEDDEEEEGGSGGGGAGVLAAAGGGFLAAQHNAVRKSAYVAPPLALATGGAASGLGSLNRGTSGSGPASFPGISMTPFHAAPGGGGAASGAYGPGALR